MATNGKHRWGKNKNDAGYQAYTMMHTNPLGDVGGRGLPDLDWSALDPLGISEATAKQVRERFVGLSKRQKERFFAIIARTSPQAVATRLDLFIEAMALAREEGNEKWRRIVSDVLGPVAKKESELNVIGEVLQLQVERCEQSRKDASKNGSATSREQEVYRLRDEGRTQAEIGSLLGISRRQVGRILARRAKPLAVGTDSSPPSREAASVERLGSDVNYREGYQDALKETSSGLKHRFVKVLEKRPDVAIDILKGRYVEERDGHVRLDMEAAERVAGVEVQMTEAVRLRKRLAERAPDFLERFEQGEFPSLRKAAIAAGIHKDTNSPTARLRAFWRRASAAERREFRKWLESDDAEKRGTR